MMSQRGRYAGARYSVDVKDALGAIGLELKERGWSVRAISEMYSDAGYGLGEETLRGWTQAVERGEPIISPDKNTGAEKKVDEEQRRVAAGWVLQGKKKSTASVTAGSYRTNLE